MTQMWARLQDSQVAEVTYIDPTEGEWHESITWVEVPEWLQPLITQQFYYSEEEGFYPITRDVLGNQLKAVVANYRWHRQSSSVWVGENQYLTDSDSVLAINVAINAGKTILAANPEDPYTVMWKTPNGFTELTVPDLEEANLAITLYVRDCFIREMQIVAALDSELADEDMSIEMIVTNLYEDMEINWPDNGAPEVVVPPEEPPVE